MNTSFLYPLATPVLPSPIGLAPANRPHHGIAPANRSQSSKNAGLSAGQLLDVELGLYLLSQLLPTAPPDALPVLMSRTEPSSADRPSWTPKQHKYLNRGRMVLAHCLQPAVWNALIERYAAVASTLTAYDVSRDRSRFGEKTVGFSRNRLTVLRKMLA